MTSDDDHDDDAQLQQLRAVWVSMRDEDPPDRGLASLMAAARTKAAELEQAASPSWWQRIAATLRRPPVLALATVTLLLGGALIVTQRGSQMKVDSTVETDSQFKGEYAAPAAGSAAIVTTGVEAPGAIDEGTPAAIEPAPVSEPSKSAGAKPPEKTRPKAATAKPSSTAKADVDTGTSAETVQPGPVAGGAGATSAPVLSIAQDDAPAEPALEAQTQAPKKPIARKPAPSIQGEDRITTKDAAAPTVDQLVKQCETAAARGDCTTVRALAQKILVAAPATYKSKVANNAAITRCMPDAAPNSAAQ